MTLSPQQDRKLIRRLRRDLNGRSVNCPPGCTACCGPVPFSPFERERAMALMPMVAMSHDIGRDTTCPYVKDCGCGIYAERPIICRLMGLSDRMPCPKGATCDKPISSHTADAITQAYLEVSDLNHIVLP